MRERDDCEIIQSCLGQDLELFLTGREKQRGCSRIHNLERMRIEADEKARLACSFCLIDQPLNDIEMSAMDSVERSNRYHCAFLHSV